jgi:hypothetical protein
MLVPIELSNPLRKISIEIDNSKALTVKENKLLLSYVKLHEQFFEISELQKKLKNDFREVVDFMSALSEQNKAIELQMKIIGEDTTKLLVKQPDYETFKIQFNALIAYISNFNEWYIEYFHNVTLLGEKLEKITADRDKCTDYYYMDEDEDTLWKEYEELTNWLFDNYEELSIDIISFDDDKEMFLTMRGDTEDDYEPLFKEINDFITDVNNPFIDGYNVTVKTVEGFNAIIKQLQSAYLMYSKATEEDNRLVWFDWSDTADKPPRIDTINYGISYDLEFEQDGTILLHLDTIMMIENLLDLSLRVSYRMKCSLEETFTKEVMEPLAGHCIELLKNEVMVNEDERVKKIDLRHIEDSYYVIEKLTTVFVEGEVAGGLRHEGPEMFEPSLLIEKPGIFGLLTATIVSVMDQLLFTNKNFDNQKNRNALNSIVSINQYITVKHHMVMVDAGPVTFNFRQHLTFLMLLDCTCQMLVGDHDYEFFKGLELVNVDAEARKLYLKTAQSFYKDTLDNFKKNNITVTFLEKTRNWNQVFF